jgi:glucose-1-phosphate cytidylyltransferase
LKTNSELTAIVLCGGKGERLRPFTETLPKVLISLKGEPLLLHLLNYLAATGIRRFVICVGYRAAAIEEFVSAHQDPSWEVVLVDSGDASMTDRLLDAQVHIHGPALICYGDTLANVDLAALRREHSASGALMTMTVYPLHSPFGIVSFEATRRVKDFAEKPRLPYWINIGFMLAEPGAFGYLTRGSEMPAFLSLLADAGAVYAFQHEGRHVTVNTEKDRALAETEIVEFFTLIDEQII